MKPGKTKTTGKPEGKLNDTRLVKECLSGDEAAWAQLIDKYKALIYSIPIKYNLPPQEAADVFQSTCVELLVRLSELRDPRALPKWLMQSPHHECYCVKRLSNLWVCRDTAANTPQSEDPPIGEGLVHQ